MYPDTKQWIEYYFYLTRKNKDIFAVMKSFISDFLIKAVLSHVKT